MVSHYSLRTTVGFAFWAGGVISPLFFDDDEGATVSDNKDRYRSTISEVYGTLMYNVYYKLLVPTRKACHNFLERVFLFHEKPLTVSPHNTVTCNSLPCLII